MARTLTRRNVVLLAILGGALLMIATTQTWITAGGVDDLSDTQHVEISGTDVADTVTAMALVSLAGALALTIARKVLRHVIAGLLIAAGVFSLITISSVVAAPEERAVEALGEVTGTTEQAASYEIAGVVWLAMAGGVILVGTGLLVLLGSSRWKDSAASKKYDRDASGTAVASAEEDPDEFDLWDGLSAGDDPTDRSAPS